ncbi:vegetative cell wall protein gp1-like isoform X2 [Dendronephthya gigantea]|uniref:vegetative cell wall protein gp1-like isoform X2 n=1 Tax=Dendronephthya gigantea TaxID=151771 RepID=UPI00106B49BD|nr:vegetative cell wall protein gp1-like isoform X2 [Dendronephthya gigantea]
MRACPKMLLLFATFVVFCIENIIHVQASCSGTCPGPPACIDMQMCSGPPYHPTCGAPLPICSIPSTPILEVAASTSPVVVVPTQEPPLEITNGAPSAPGGTPSGPPGTNTTPNPNKPPTNTNGNTPPVNTNQPSGAQPSPTTPPINAQPSKPPTSANNISPNSNTPSPNTNPPSQIPPNTQPSAKPPTNGNNISPAGNIPPSQPAAPQPTSPTNTNNNISPVGNTPPKPASPSQPISPSQPAPPQSTPPNNANNNISPAGNTPPKPTSPLQPAPPQPAPPQPAPPQSTPPNNANNNISPVGNTPPKPTSPSQPAPPQSTPPNNANNNISPVGSTPPASPASPQSTPPNNANSINSPVGNTPPASPSQPAPPQSTPPQSTPGKPGVSANCGDMVKTCSDGKHVTVTVSVPVNGGTSSTNATGELQRDENVSKTFDFCPVMFKRKGCYKDKHDGIHPLPELLFTDRDSSSKVFSGTTISSKDWGNYIQKLICRCAEQANQKRFTLFGIQHYGDCWSGMQSSVNNYESQGRSRACIGGDQAPCEEGSAACVGEDGANFVYELTGGPGPEKKNKIVRKKKRIKAAKRKHTINSPIVKEFHKLKNSLNWLHRSGRSR